MKKSKILAILPSKVLYGKERSNIEVYNLLAENGKDISIVVNKDSDKKIFDYLTHFRTYPIIFANRHHKYLRCMRYIWGFFRSNMSLLLILLKVRPQIIFICSELSFYDHFILFTFCKARIVYRIGDEPAFFKLSNYGYNSRVWYKFVCKKVDTFVCISDYIKKTVENAGRFSNNDTIIYNYPPRRKKNNVNESSKYMALGKGVIRFGYIGQLISQKGVDLLLMAAKNILERNEKVILYIAGSLEYDKEFSKKLLEIRQSFPNQNLIQFLDEIEDIDMFFDNIDVLCVPSIKEEPLGNVLVEAKQHLTPCIIFKSGGMPELISHEQNGYICAKSSIEGLTEAIEYYINNSELLPLHSNNAHNSILELGMDYESFQKKWLDVFN